MGQPSSVSGQDPHDKHVCVCAYTHKHADVSTGTPGHMLTHERRHPGLLFALSHLSDSIYVLALIWDIRALNSKMLSEGWDPDS